MLPTRPFLLHAEISKKHSQTHSSSSLQLSNPPLNPLNTPQFLLQLLPLILQPQPLLRVQLAEKRTSLAIKLQYPRMILPQTLPVTDGK
jgi:hypothetical protein